MSSENPTGTVGGYPMQDNSNMSVGGFPQPGTSIGGYPAQPTTENKTEQPTLPPTDTQMTQNINITNPNAPTGDNINQNIGNPMDNNTFPNNQQQQPILVPNGCLME